MTNTDGSESSGKLPVKILNLHISQGSSQDYSDPDIGMVLRWHISICPICKDSVNRKPAIFGKPSKVFCAEYWEIIGEYSDYERLYAQMGNP